MLETKLFFHPDAAGTQQTRAAASCDPLAALKEADAYCAGVCRYRDHGTLILCGFQQGQDFTLSQE